MNKPINSDDCRIQCRFPDGSTLKLVFPSKEPLQVVYNAVNEDERKPSSFFLMQSYPRKKLTEMDKSLLELGLTPSAVILVVSEKEGNELLLPTYSYFEMLIGFLFTPFAAIWRFFYSFLNNRETSNKENKTSTKKKNEKGETTVKDGNIRRFKEDSSDHSDTDATWNGNSTQQL
ncbi:UBX domain-containing protein [Meloidogyne graminicola]|uniref:UBX domain-containing protein 4 n=1 Tax=Meloidogyne graminicola TaxID=189291 RepID=A0A8S9ZFL7_9BILA|nr:UBX domain-containing protein [Meloidogyne graminicola]